MTVSVLGVCECTIFCDQGAAATEVTENVTFVIRKTELRNVRPNGQSRLSNRVPTEMMDHTPHKDTGFANVVTESFIKSTRFRQNHLSAGHRRKRSF